MNIHHVLREGRALLADPNSWTQGTNARDERGFGVYAWSPSACSWCSAGAILKLKAMNFQEIQGHLEKAILSLHPNNPQKLETFNDSHSHLEVLAVWDKAIQNANS